MSIGRPRGKQRRDAQIPQPLRQWRNETARREGVAAYRLELTPARIRTVARLAGVTQAAVKRWRKRKPKPIRLTNAHLAEIAKLASKPNPAPCACSKANPPKKKRKKKKKKKQPQTVEEICGASYEDFRGGMSWDEAYMAQRARHDRNVASGDYSQPPRRAAVLGLMRQTKQEEYDELRRHCDDVFDLEGWTETAPPAGWENPAGSQSNPRGYADLRPRPNKTIARLQRQLTRLGNKMKAEGFTDGGVWAKDAARFKQWAADDKADARYVDTPSGRDIRSIITTAQRHAHGWKGGKGRPGRKADLEWADELGDLGFYVSQRTSYPYAAPFKGRRGDRRSQSKRNPAQRAKQAPQVRDSSGNWITYTGPRYKAPGVPELAITKKLTKADKPGKRWTLTHKLSGMALPVTFATREAAAKAVKRARAKVPDVPWRWYDWNQASAHTRAMVQKFIRGL